MTPRLPEENEKIRQKRRLAIIQAALELFALRGYQRTSISEIAKTAGISKGLMYNYFENKEDLLKSVVIYNFKEASDALYALFTDKINTLSHQELLAFIIEAFFQMMQENKAVWKLSVSLSMQVGDMPEIKQLLAQIFDESYERLTRLLPPSDDVANQARIIAATLDGIALQFYLIGDTYDLEGVKKSLINNLINK